MAGKHRCRVDAACPAAQGGRSGYRASGTCLRTIGAYQQGAFGAGLPLTRVGPERAPRGTGSVQGTRKRVRQRRAPSLAPACQSHAPHSFAVLPSCPQMAAWSSTRPNLPRVCLIEQTSRPGEKLREVFQYCHGLAWLRRASRHGDRPRHARGPRADKARLANGGDRVGIVHAGGKGGIRCGEPSTCAVAATESGTGSRRSSMSAVAADRATSPGAAAGPGRRARPSAGAGHGGRHCVDAAGCGAIGGRLPVRRGRFRLHAGR
ncbi:hypothetical protein B7759_05286 [Burkholderia glumae]|nr:hypothetical protein KS03_4385 [Burkholderia glumae LMG 2196 = ATCC 33617]QKM56202.1 hypothetical protein CG017_04266 [Burkholderia glumae]QTP36648.1 hypothetical protein B7759_05286 [Burkholderia glumae]